ncbi:hypothetical protein ACWDTP_08830 [Mycobacterium sp. NPDC003449]
MSNILRCLAASLAVSGIVSLSVLFGAPPAAAAPQCTNTTPTTTQCQTKGSTAIVTSPPAINYGPWYGWGIGGVVLGW